MNELLDNYNITELLILLRFLTGVVLLHIAWFLHKLVPVTGKTILSKLVKTSSLIFFAFAIMRLASAYFDVTFQGLFSNIVNLITFSWLLGILIYTERKIRKARLAPPSSGSTLTEILDSLLEDLTPSKESSAKVCKR